MPGTFTSLRYHVVFGTRDRQPSIDDGLRARLHAYLGGIINESGGTPLAVGGVSDHVHLLMGMPADRALADVVRVVKSNSSKWVHQSTPQRAFGWQDGYSAFTVSASQVERVRGYVHEQEAHHYKRTFEEEYVALLQRHGIEFDPRYVLA